MYEVLIYQVKIVPLVRVLSFHTTQKNIIKTSVEKAQKGQTLNSQPKKIFLANQILRSPIFENLT